MLYPRLGENADSRDWEQILNGPRRNDNEIKYREWLKSCPYAHFLISVFEKMALEKANRGTSFGSRALMERVRWEVSVDRGREEDEEDYKINNSFSPYIARDLISLHPKLIEFLSTKSIDEEVYVEEYAHG